MPKHLVSWLGLLIACIGLAAGQDRPPAAPSPVTGKGATPSAQPGYPKALERAKRLAGFRYLDTKRFSCGGKAFDVARFEHAKTKLVFHLVPGGVYSRGSRKGRSGEKPVARVKVKPFLICATEFTQAAWQRVMGTNPSRFKGASRPVETISWTDAQSLCRKAGLRLPSEAEWEYACRAASTRAYCYGDGDAQLGRYAVYGFKKRGVTQTAKVGSKLPNAFGLHDTHGNVWEWCEDVYGSYDQAPADGSARGTGGSKRVGRGGSWYYPTRSCRSAMRRKITPGNRNYDLGFRPAKSLP
jgi:formylglycine-generating enzyme required for sulfatase activity